ncbi:MAG: hypothetical protein QOF01_1644 [Thermomicrobiales bacterium]|jgi:hypothetical protein|nr:hypothetical protein [Thermomicrobiales bacterium]MEA2526997.1 hypothetical protein [Thermomicrobiales bacterium]MEA2595175.1 hypothetical protein [Thermomicrobiales bacterium]
MKRALTTSVLALLLATGLAPLLSGGIAAAADTVTLAIEGGDATAVGACVNVVKDGERVVQKNTCKNKAVGRGGDVSAKGLCVTVVNDGDKVVQKKCKDKVVVKGEDKVVQKKCKNRAVGHGGGKVVQKNTCKNKAVGRGGDVVLKNASILVIPGNL